MEILTEFQKEIIHKISRSELAEKFFLTGGTALSVCYLQHRFSLDLDFFTDDPTAISQVSGSMNKIASELRASISFTRTLDTFLECFLESSKGEMVQFDFAVDSPYRLKPLEKSADLNINVENLEDIACNKLSALFDRAEAKDFVDIFFLCQKELTFEELVEKTKKKHLGIDDYWLAVALRRVEQIEILPKMIKQLDVAEMKTFFLKEAKKLLDQMD